MIFFIFRGFLLVSAITLNPKVAHHGFSRTLSLKTSKDDKPKQMTVCITYTAAFCSARVTSLLQAPMSSNTNRLRPCVKAAMVQKKLILRQVLTASVGLNCLCQGEAYSPPILTE